jgi:transposase
VIQVTPQMRILLACEPVDFRKGIDGLAGIVKSLDLDPMSGYLFVFCSRSGTSIKIICYDGQGFWICQKRLSKGRFRFWPKDGTMTASRPTSSRPYRGTRRWIGHRCGGPSNSWTRKGLSCILISMRYVGREFTETDMDIIRDLISRGFNRTRISRVFCEKTDWRKPDGGLKEMICRVALLKMHRGGHILLPNSERPANNHLKRGKRTALPLPCAVTETGEIRMEIADKTTSGLWNELIDRHHYLGFTPLPGAQIRYFVRSGDQILAALSFSAAAWKCAPRDNHIGWDGEKRKENLHLVVNNSRFLILPWVQSKNLASRILSTAARRIAADWKERSPSFSRPSSRRTAFGHLLQGIQLDLRGRDQRQRQARYPS